MLDRDVAGLGGARLTARIAVFVVAVILGGVVPLGIVLLLAGRDPYPQSCHAGRATAAGLEGTILFADRGALWLVESDVSHPRKLVDYNPAPSPAPRSPAALAPAVPQPPSTPSRAPAASPSPTVSPEILAAAISSDHHAVVFIVSDAPDAKRRYSLRLLDPLETPAMTPSEAWSGDRVGDPRNTRITVLPQGGMLFQVPAHLDPPETSDRLVGVISPKANPKLVQYTPENAFLGRAHSTWPETKDYKLPKYEPHLDDRIEGPDNVVAGRRDRELHTPLTTRLVHQVMTGRQGDSSLTAVCAARDDLAPAAFSPDGRTLALSGGGSSYLLDLSGGHAVVFLLYGRVLDWRP